MDKNPKSGKTLVRQDSPDDAGFTTRTKAETEKPLVKKDSPDDVREDRMREFKPR